MTKADTKCPYTVGVTLFTKKQKVISSDFTFFKAFTHKLLTMTFLHMTSVSTYGRVHSIFRMIPHDKTCCH